MNRKKKNKSKKSRDPLADLQNLPKFRADMETMKSPRFVECVRQADVILTFPTSPEWNPQIAYGTQTLQRIVATGFTEVAATLCIVIDWASDEPEYLHALLLHIKGGCDFNQS